MARQTRLALAGEMHYLIQRGHNRQDVFADDRDRETYLAMLRDAAAQYGVAIHAYALLQSEVHLLATPAAAESLSRLMQSLGRRYVASSNRRHGRTGTLWAGRFRAGVIEGAAFGADAVVHVESLAARLGVAGAEPEWPWSSAAHHLGRRRDPLITEHPAYWALGNTPFERELAHAHRLRHGLSKALVDGLVSAAMQGRPFGPDTFIARIAAMSGHSPRSKPRGRPARAGGAAADKTVPN